MVEKNISFKKIVECGMITLENNMIYYRKFTVCIVLIAIFSGCTMGPDYVKPKMEVASSFKEQEGWKVAQPKDDVSRDQWWSIFHDSVLDSLISQVAVSNQNILSAEASYRQAVALVQQADASYYPTLNGNASAIRSKPASNLTNTLNYNPNYNTAYRGSLSASWIPDLWGSIKRSVEASKAGADSSYASIEAAKLSSQSLLAQDYYLIRFLDAKKILLNETCKSYEQVLQLTKNQYDAGIVTRSDVINAETQLKSTQVQSVDLDIQRAQYEHAIAILIGKAPIEFSITPLPNVALGDIPAVPLEIPSALLERRPDIASAERLVAQANAQIGVAEAAFYPSLTIAPTFGYQSTQLSNLLDTPARFWSIGPALAGPIFDGGLRKAQKDATIAAYDQSVAKYKQTVLTAFQQVEDNLVTLRTLENEFALQSSVVNSANDALQLAVNQYKAGIVNYINVSNAQNVALANEINALNIQSLRFNSTIGLIVALGGNWNSLHK
jgi:NodT family efflux transporter outer membrane factor (OMF) lipoprotein